MSHPHAGLFGRPFDGVAGHKGSMVYGAPTPCGARTLIKRTTAWEVLWYTAIALSTTLSHEAGTGHAGETASWSETAWPKLRAEVSRWSGSCATLMRAVGPLSSWTAALAGVAVPCDYLARVESARASTSPCGAPENDTSNCPTCCRYVHDPHGARSCDAPSHTDRGTHEASSVRRGERWLCMHCPEHVTLLARVLAFMVDTMHTHDALLRALYEDNTRWCVCLLDATADMQHASVMDVKLGAIQHSPFTHPGKVHRLLCRYEASPLMTSLGLRVCGMRRCYYRVEGGEGGMAEAPMQRECVDKREGYTMRERELLAARLRMFFCTTQLYATSTLRSSKAVACVCTDVGCGSLREEDSRDTERGECGHDCPLRVPVATRARNRKEHGACGCACDACLRRRSASRQLSRMVDYFCESADGRLVLQTMALVSVSVLFVYDANKGAGGEVARVRVLLIDFARSSPRERNFDEDVVGFTRGLRGLLLLLTEPYGERKLQHEVTN